MVDRYWSSRTKILWHYWMKTKIIGFQTKKLKHAPMAAAPRTLVSSSGGITVAFAALLSARTAQSKRISRRCSFRIPSFKAENKSMISSPKRSTRRMFVFACLASAIVSCRFRINRLNTTSTRWMSYGKRIIKAIRALKTTRACSLKIKAWSRALVQLAWFQRLQQMLPKIIWLSFMGQWATLLTCLTLPYRRWRWRKTWPKRQQCQVEEALCSISNIWMPKLAWRKMKATMKKLKNKDLLPISTTRTKTLTKISTIKAERWMILETIDALEEDTKVENHHIKSQSLSWARLALLLEIKVSKISAKEKITIDGRSWKSSQSITFIRWSMTKWLKETSMQTNGAHFFTNS